MSIYIYIYEFLSFLSIFQICHHAATPSLIYSGYSFFSGHHQTIHHFELKKKPYKHINIKWEEISLPLHIHILIKLLEHYEASEANSVE